MKNIIRFFLPIIQTALISLFIIAIVAMILFLNGSLEKNLHYLETGLQLSLSTSLIMSILSKLKISKILDKNGKLKEGFLSIPILGLLLGIVYALIIQDVFYVEHLWEIMTILTLLFCLISGFIAFGAGIMSVLAVAIPIMMSWGHIRSRELMFLMGAALIGTTLDFLFWVFFIELPRMAKEEDNGIDVPYN